nr:MAG TPA: hypothetical protein [Caudoviricetes sp.]
MGLVRVCLWVSKWGEWVQLQGKDKGGERGKRNTSPPY